MSRDNAPKLNAQISEEAAQWFVEIRSGDIDAAGREQFDAWVRSSPEHLRAYLEIAAIWNERDALAERRTADTDLEGIKLGTDNVIDLPRVSEPVVSESKTSSQSVSSRRRRFAIAASIVALAMTIGGVARFQSTGARTYATDIGEQRQIRLTDGSTVELNSRSRVRVRLSDAERRVELLDGQAFFHVAKDRARPFIVHSDALRVRAVGTQFDVNRKKSGTTVTVLEGRVAVTGGFSLGAGEQITVRPRVAPSLVRANVAAATAWTQHQLIFESAPLTEVAEEFNRYSMRTLVVDDRGSEPLRLSGVFATDPEFLIQYLRGRADVSIQESDTQIRITRQD